MDLFGTFTGMKRRQLFSSVFAITERRDMGMYKVPLFIRNWERDYVTQLPYVRYDVVVKSLLVRIASARGSMCFVVIVCHQYDICKILLAVCMLVGMVV